MIAPSTQHATQLRFDLVLNGGIPNVRVATFDDEHQNVIGSYGTDVQHLLVPLAAESVSSIVAEDVLEHVVDESAFLHECARLLRIGGRLELRVPAEGITGWLDALNIYRYLTDITGRGNDPKEADPVGWHRHYQNDDIVRIVCDAGFDVTSVRRTNPGLSELPHLTGLMIGDYALDRPETEVKLFDWRRRIADFENRVPAGPFGTRFTLIAYRV